MNYRHFRPLPALAGYIECFWIIEATAESAAKQQRATMPADSRATLLLNFTGDSRLIGDGVTHPIYEGGTLLGAHSQSYVLEHEGDTYLIAAQFRPGGLASFVRCASGELTDQTTALDLLWGRAGEWLCEQIDETGDDAQKLALYQNALAERFAEVPHQPRILYALQRIEQGSSSVEALAADANLSQKHFERLFERTVGMMPKRYIRLARFQRLVTWLTRCGETSVNWTTLAAQFGYYDHSHLVKDFQAFAGTTPSEFTAAAAGIVEVAYGEPEEG